MAYLPTIIFALCAFLVMEKSLWVLNHMNRKTPIWLRMLYIATSTLGFCGLLVQAQPHWWLALIALVLTILFIEWDPLHGHEGWEKLKGTH
jgi:hypothetical protein